MYDTDMIVFVYGTLKRGFGNHSFMEAAEGEFLGEGKVPGVMIDLQAFPGVVAAEALPRSMKKDFGDSQVHGEFYKVKSSRIRILDGLEGHRGKKSRDNFYTRIKFRNLDAEDTEGKPIQRAWVYTLPTKYLNEHKIITRGVWGE